MIKYEQLTIARVTTLASPCRDYLSLFFYGPQTHIWHVDLDVPFDWVRPGSDGSVDKVLSDEGLFDVIEIMLGNRGFAPTYDELRTAVAVVKEKAIAGTTVYRFEKHLNNKE